MMTGRENLCRAIEFRTPQYLPCTFSAMLDWLRDKDPAKQARVRELTAATGGDVLSPGQCFRGRWKPADRNRWRDEWGTEWLNEGYGAISVDHPLQSGYDGLDGLYMPDPDEPGRFDEADQGLAERDGLYVRADVWNATFERMWMLRGFDNLLMDPYVEPAGFARLRDRITEIHLGMVDQWLRRKVDGIFFSDDWGTQRALLMDPRDWRRLYKPAYRRLFDRVRAGGAHVWLHSCGDVRAILPDLLDLGLSVLHPVQPQAMDLAELAREFGGKVCFYGGIDSQGVLITGTPVDVRDEVRRVVDLLGGPDGGYIGAPSQTVMPETPLDNVIAALETLAEYQ